ncbi:MAG TPA: CHASE2 domain-containing protein, partial [Gallionella sp.]|nr:CHASE2 domain-containing protein [Gallionella sp.]
MNQTKLKRYQWVGFALCLLLAATVHFSKISEPLDHLLLDSQFKWLRQYHPQPVIHDVVVVGIDEATYAAFPEPLALWHPHLGKLFQAFAQGKPALVALDVVLPERSYNFLIPQYDLPLLQGLMQLRAQSQVLLGRSVDGNGKFRKIFPPYISITGSDSQPSVMVCLDADGVARRFEGNLCSDDTPVQTLAGKMAGLDGAGGKAVKGLIDYSIGAPFSYIPFMDVVSWYEQGDTGKLEQMFSGKTVLVGVIMPYTDRVDFPAPIAAWEPAATKLPGVLWHAQAYRSLKFHGLIHEMSKAALLILTLAAALLWFGRLGWIKAALFGVFLTGVLAYSLVQLTQSLYLPVGAVLLSGTMAFIVRAIYEAVMQMRERRLLRGTFGSYVSPQILQEIIAGNIKPGLGGERKRLCVLFSDIRD